MIADRSARQRCRSRHDVRNRTRLLGLLGLAAVVSLAGCGSSVPAAAVPMDGPAPTLP